MSPGWVYFFKAARSGLRQPMVATPKNRHARAWRGRPHELRGNEPGGRPEKSGHDEPGDSTSAPRPGAARGGVRGYGSARSRRARGGAGPPAWRLQGTAERAQGDATEEEKKGG